MTTQHRGEAGEARDEERSLTDRAAAAAHAELRGDRGAILGALGTAALLPLKRTRTVPERWTLLQHRRGASHDPGRALVVEDQHAGKDREMRMGISAHRSLRRIVWHSSPPKRAASQCLVGFCLALAGCTTAQQALFQADVVAFNNDVALIDSTIATVSTALANNCTQLAATGQALSVLIGTSTAAGSGLVGVDAAIVSYCQAHPNNIATAVSATSAAISAGKAAQTAAKAGN